MCVCVNAHTHDYQNAQHVGMHSAGLLLVSDIFLLILANCRYLHIFLNPRNCNLLSLVQLCLLFVLQKKCYLLVLIGWLTCPYDNGFAGERNQKCKVTL